ncbi:hypothetical protein GCM10027414_04780 [Humibacter ginsengiterrae]
MAPQFVPVALIVGGGALAVGGAAAGAVGGIQIKSARTQIHRRAQRYDKRHTAHLRAVDATNEALQFLGKTQERAQREIINRMKDFLLRHEKQVRAHERLVLDGIELSDTRIAGDAKLDANVAGWVRGVIGAAGVAVGVPAALSAGVKKLASASTGTPISALSGAAAEKARLAFLGGGSIKSGGGGIKLGKTANGIAAIGPAALVAGLAVKNQGTRARTAAEHHRTEVDTAIATLDARDELLRGIQERARELEALLVRLIVRAAQAIDLLESEPFDINIHLDRLHSALNLVGSVREVTTAPIADEDGNIDQRTEQLLFTYRQSQKEPSDG